jgi:cyclomaltodextrinase
VDYYHVDRRLGNDDTLACLSEAIHRRGMRLVLDAVFNHVGRDFWAFYELRRQGEHSPYRDWFHNLRFGESSPYGDAFSYCGWNGHYDLVKLNVRNPDVKEHLLGAVETWVKEFDVDGLRLDAADQIDVSFLKELAVFSRQLRLNFWLMGEIIHGDYRKWANPDTLDSVTNYECYKGLYSSHNDSNYFEIAYSFNRQFGEEGMYRDLPLYAFVDNHDVNRLASSLSNPDHLGLVYTLLFTMPGVPSVYYGSEWGIKGRKTDRDDTPLRPSLELQDVSLYGDFPQLADVIRKLAEIRRRIPALRYGDYLQLYLDHRQFAFARRTGDQQVVVVVNAAEQPVSLRIPVPLNDSTHLVDTLHPGDRFPIQSGEVLVDSVPACGARIMVAE